MSYTNNQATGGAMVKDFDPRYRPRRPPREAIPHSTSHPNPVCSSAGQSRPSQFRQGSSAGSISSPSIAALGDSSRIKVFFNGLSADLRRSQGYHPTGLHAVYLIGDRVAISFAGRPKAFTILLTPTDALNIDVTEFLSSNRHQKYGSHLETLAAVLSTKGYVLRNFFNAKDVRPPCRIDSLNDATLKELQEEAVLCQYVGLRMSNDLDNTKRMSWEHAGVSFLHERNFLAYLAVDTIRAQLSSDEGLDFHVDFPSHAKTMYVVHC
jgi:hypothetical protein